MTDTTIRAPDYTKLGELIDIIGRRNYVGIPEAALILGLHPQTIRNMIKRGQLKTILIGSRHKIFLEEIDRIKSAGNHLNRQVGAQGVGDGED